MERTPAGDLAVGALRNDEWDFAGGGRVCRKRCDRADRETQSQSCGPCQLRLEVSANFCAS
ncbi:MAG: hypothetical protein WA117_22610 [Verrucomicrobiia bacterium]